MQALAYINASCVIVQGYCSQLAAHKKKQLVSTAATCLKAGVSKFRAKLSVVAILPLFVVQVLHTSPLAVDYLFFTICVD